MKLISLGMILVGIAVAMHWYLQRHAAAAGPGADFTNGLLYGVAIGIMLLGLWREARARRRDAQD